MPSVNAEFVQALPSISKPAKVRHLAEPIAPRRINVLLRHPGFKGDEGRWPGRDTVMVSLPVTKPNPYPDVAYVTAELREAIGKAVRHAARSHLHHPVPGHPVIEEILDGIEVVEAGFEGVTVPHGVTLRDRHGPFRFLEVHATSEAEADFQARWMHCKNKGMGAGDLQAMFKLMEEVEVVEFDYTNSSSSNDFRDILAALVDEVMANNGSGPALDLAVAHLRARGIAVGDDPAEDDAEVSPPGP